MTLTAGEVAWALIGAVSLALWWVSLRLYPYARCLPCGGTGRRVGSTRKRFGLCRRCGGTGRRRRFGAALINRGRL